MIKYVISLLCFIFIMVSCTIPSEPTDDSADVIRLKETGFTPTFENTNFFYHYPWDITGKSNLATSTEVTFKEAPSLCFNASDTDTSLGLHIYAPDYTILVFQYKTVDATADMTDDTSPVAYFRVNGTVYENLVKNEEWQVITYSMRPGDIYYVEFTKPAVLDENNGTSLYLNTLKCSRDSVMAISPVVLDDFETGDYNAIPWKLEGNTIPTVKEEEDPLNQYSYTLVEGGETNSLSLKIKTVNDSLIYYEYKVVNSVDYGVDILPELCFNFTINDISVIQVSESSYWGKCLFKLEKDREYVLKWNMSMKDPYNYARLFIDNLTLCYGDVEFLPIE